MQSSTATPETLEALRAAADERSVSSWIWRAVEHNNTTQIDLQGQAASESNGHRRTSGSGGQTRHIKGRSIPEGAKAKISLARPTSVMTSSEEARTHGLIPRLLV